MEKENKKKSEQLDVSKMFLETFQLVPPRQQHNSWVSNLRKSGKYSNASTIRIVLDDDRESRESLNITNLSKKFLHSHPLQSLQNTQVNITDVMRNINVTCKHILKSDYERILEEYSQKNLKFTDPQFPPVQSSIGDGLPVYKWKRISQIIQNPQFVKQIIQPSDVLQGQIGDCYFLSAVAALAQNDYRIKNIFQSLQVQKNGIYMARILHQGILMQVVVDDFIPVKNDNTPVFAKPSGGNQIWVIILQKCWAKLYGSYEAIVGGLPHQVLHSFSGAPTYYHLIPTQKSSQDQLFQRVYRSYEEGDILCCGTKPNLEIQTKGLVRGHAYTILGIYKNHCKLIKLRNPWGQLQWNGKASEKDSTFWSTFSPEFKQLVGYSQYSEEDVPDGIFFMVWQDFVELFQMIDVCRMRDNSSYFCYPAQFSHKNGKIFEFELLQSAQITIAISQRGLRGATKSRMKAGYSKTTIILGKCSKISGGNEYKFIKSNQNLSFPDHYLDAHILTEGHYVFYIKADWIEKGQQQAVVSVYTQAKVNLRQSKKGDHKDFLFKIFMNHARRNTNQRMIINQQPLEWICSDFLANHGSYGYSVYHIDKNSTSRFCIQFDQGQIFDYFRDFKKQNLVLKKPYKRNGKIKTIVKPGQELIILFKLRAYHYTQKLTIPIPKVYKF